MTCAPFVSDNHLTAVTIAVFEFTGYIEDGNAYDPVGRATVVLGRNSVGKERLARDIHALFHGTQLTHSV